MIVALVGQKGGVGKSTVVVVLAAEWLRRGLRVLVVDADTQGTLITWHEVAGELEQPRPEAVAMGADLWERLPELIERFDHVVIDCPPRMAAVQRAALAVVDVALIPCGPGVSDAWALSAMVELVTEARDLRPELVAVVLLNQLDRRTALAREARESLKGCGLLILGAELGDRVAFVEALAMGEGVTTYAPSSAAAQEVKALVDELETLIRK